MKKVLAFCFFPAFVPPSNGGQQRLFNFYRALSRWYDVTLLTSTHYGGTREVVRHGLNFVEKRIPKDAYFVEQYANLESCSGGGDLSGPAIAAAGCWPTSLHQAYLEEYAGADIIFHDFPFTVDYDLFAGLDNKLRVYNAHNCETDLYQQLHPGKKSSPVHELVRGVESRMLSVADMVLFCNREDFNRFREIAPGASFEGMSAPNGMMPVRIPPRSVTGCEETRAIFMGSGHPPNLHAAKFIVEKLAPALPGVHFDIVGSCLAEGIYPSNVHRHGVVDDQRKLQLLQSCRIALNPMEAGSGSNVKVLEYFAHGLLVVSTKFGMRGIEVEPEVHYCEASLEDFQIVLTRLLERPELFETIGTQGREFALENYTWDAIVAPVAERLKLLSTQALEKSEKRHALVLNDYDSFASIGGGATRTRGLCEALRAWLPVVFVCFSSDGSLRKREDAGITIITIPKTQQHLAEEVLVNSQFHISATDILASRHCLKNPWLGIVYDNVKSSAACIVVEHCYMAGLPLARGDRFVHSSQNHEAQLKKKLLEFHPLRDELLADLEALENRTVEYAGLNVAVSHEDASSLVVARRMAGPVVVVRNGVPPPLMGEEVDHAKKILESRIGTPAVVFLGSAHMPNLEAARYITEQIAPGCPEVRFHLIGSVCSSLDKVPGNVTLWGVVDEKTKSAVMQSCCLAINPMITGSGSNVKVADYLANGLFVITTQFGLRGYSDTAGNHVAAVALDEFSQQIRKVIATPALYALEARTQRHSLFEREFSMQGAAQRFVDLIRDQEKPRKRVLYVAYRYSSPPLGGAEVNMEKFIQALAKSGDFEVDVIAPEISSIHSHLRFSERYGFDPGISAAIDMPRVRFARFPVAPPDSEDAYLHLRRVWSQQPGFERIVDASLHDLYQESGLTWGWAYPEGEGKDTARWSFLECGLFLKEAAQVELRAYADTPCVITACCGNESVGGPWSVEGSVTLAFQSPAGGVSLVVSRASFPADPRPLGIRLSRIMIAGKQLDLSQETLIQQCLPNLSADQRIRLLDQAAQQTRGAALIRLTDGRGPWSPGMERFLTERIAEYDLVVSHNNVFRPAVVAMAEAKRQGVPSLLIPHAHLDDDYYHFPDLIESARNATKVLAVPQAACRFFADKGCVVKYMPAGCDANEEFSSADQQAFHRIHSDKRPFILVLGRKAKAKGYHQIIDAVDKLNEQGTDLQVILIGPDDDGIPVQGRHCVYLGRQPREVVRGALMSCIALCNMSTSESFGIVLLEAWLAEKPVIINKECAAFHDLAQDGHNALMVDRHELASAISKLLSEPLLCKKLAGNGKAQVAQFDWQVVADSFVAECQQLVHRDCAPVTVK